jgi:hypothetical protein
MKQDKAMTLVEEVNEHPLALAILTLLFKAKQRLTLTQIAITVARKPPTVLDPLRFLLDKSLVVKERQGKETLYSVSNNAPFVEKYLSASLTLRSSYKFKRTLYDIIHERFPEDELITRIRSFLSASNLYVTVGSKMQTTAGRVPIDILVQTAPESRFGDKKVGLFVEIRNKYNFPLFWQEMFEWIGRFYVYGTRKAGSLDGFLLLVVMPPSNVLLPDSSSSPGEVADELQAAKIVRSLSNKQIRFDMVTAHVHPDNLLDPSSVNEVAQSLLGSLNKLLQS